METILSVVGGGDMDEPGRGVEEEAASLSAVVALGPCWPSRRPLSYWY